MFLIGLGANLSSPAGTPRETLEAAFAAIERSGVRIEARSRWYRTPAHPPGSGPEFVNGAAALASGMSAEALLAVLHRIETDLDRKRQRRWGARTCDLDLLASGALVLPDAAEQARWMRLAPEAQGRVAPETLVLPHPRMHERSFVLVPLAQIAPDWQHPVLGQTVTRMLARRPLQERRDVRPLDTG